MFIPYPKPVDKKKFDIGTNNTEIKYGLPRKIQFCKNCVISNQRPTSSIEFRTNKKQEKKTRQPNNWLLKKMNHMLLYWACH